jgi:hypothetical protein
MLFGAALMFTSQAFADDDTWALDRYGFYAGSFTNDLNLRGRINGNIEAEGTIIDGTVVDFDREFDFGGSHSLLLLGGTWRPFDRHQLSFDYHRDTREGSRSLQRDIVFEGETFPVNARVDAKYQAEVYDLRYTYWAWLTQRNAFGVSLGLVDYRVGLSLRGEGTFSDTGTMQSLKASTDSDIPAPLLGLSYRHAFNERLRFFADAARFKARFHSVDGDVTDLHAGIEYFPWEHVGFAALYSIYEIDADVERHSLKGQLDLRSSGFQLLLRIRD